MTTDTPENENLESHKTINDFDHDINPLWEKADFDSAIAVILTGERKIMFNLLQMDTLYASSSRRKLNTDQLNLITGYLSGKTKYSDSLRTDCFQPYHGIFFYKDGIITGRLAICFGCNNFFTQPKPAVSLDLHKTKILFGELGLPVYNWDNEIEIKNAPIKYSDFFQKK